MSSTPKMIRRVFDAESLPQPFALGSRMRTGPGPCAICGKDADFVIRCTTALGVPATARACSAHEGAVEAALREIDTIPPRMAKRYVKLAKKEIERANRLAEKYQRMRAKTQGASSITHAFALHAGAYRREADGWKKVLAIAEELE